MPAIALDTAPPKVTLLSSPAAAPTPQEGVGRVGWSLEWTLPLLICSLLVLVVAIFGLAIGSFLNVVIHRLP